MRNTTKLMAVLSVIVMLAVCIVPISDQESDAADGVLESLYPGSWTWDTTTGIGPFNSFYAAFDMTDGNRFFAILNPYDLTETIAGVDLDPLSNYNIMWVLPTVYWSADGNTVTLTNDSTSGGTAYAHTIDGKTYNYVAYGVYHGTKKAVGGVDVLTSESGVAPTANQTRAVFRDQANNYVMDSSLGVDAHSMLWNFYQWTLFKLCCYTVMEDFNSQATVGNGNVNGGNYAKLSGSLDTYGPYAGNNGELGSSGSGAATYGKDVAKLFIEEPWGTVRDFVDGVVINTSSNTGIYIDSSSVPTDSTTAGGNVDYVAQTIPAYNWGTAISTNEQTWGFPTVTTSTNSYNVGMTDKAGGSGDNRVLCVGGYSNTDASYSVGYGLSYAYAYFDTSYLDSSVGSRLAFVFDAGPASASGTNYTYTLEYNPTLMATTSAAISVAGVNPISHDAPPLPTVTIDVNESGYGSIDTQTVSNVPIGTALSISGNTITIDQTTITATPTTATQQYTYTFKGWYAGDTLLTSGYVINTDTTITAVFERALTTYLITIQSNNTEYGTVDVGTVPNTPYSSVMHLSGPGQSILTITNATTSQDTVITATAADPDVYYTYGFDGYETDGQRIQDGDTITGARTIIANFSRTDIYTVIITPDPEGYGNVSVGQVTGIPSGNLITIDGNVLEVYNVSSTATPTTDTAQYDYEFTGWSVTNNTPVTENMTVYAQFSRELRSYTITWSINGVTETDTYDYGETPTHVNPSVVGYNFKGWSPTITKVTGDQTYTATLTPIVYTITWDANEGVVDTSTSQGSIEQSITAPTPTRSWYVFDGWFTDPENGTEITSPFYPTANATYYAHWSPLTYTVTLNANGGSTETATVTGSPITSATLPEATYTDRNLIGWFTDTSDGELVGIPGTIVYPSADVTYYAVWSDDVVYSYNINFNVNGGFNGPSALVATSLSEGTHTFTVPDTVPEKDGVWYFKGWATTSAGTAEYNSGDEITLQADETITLYAVWSDTAPADYGWIKNTVPIMVGVGLLVGSASIIYTSKGNTTELIRLMIALVIGVLMLAVILVPILGGL